MTAKPKMLPSATTRNPDDEIEVTIRVRRSDLAAVLGAVAMPVSVPTHHDSRNLPPGVRSARAYRDRVRHMPGARRVGRDIVITVADWDRGIAATTTTKSPKLAPQSNDDVDTLIARRGLELRVVGGKR